MNILGNKSIVPNIKLNWREYYLNFSREHGGNPIQYGNMLLFRDGWRYSLNSYAGPEHSPPEDEYKLKKLQLLYWRRRRNIFAAEKTRLDRQINSLELMSGMKSLPLIHTKRRVAANGEVQIIKEEINVDFYKDMRQDLINELLTCEEHINEYEVFLNEQ